MRHGTAAYVAPSHVKMPLYVKMQLNVQNINAKCENAIYEKVILNMKTLGSLSI